MLVNLFVITILCLATLGFYNQSCRLLGYKKMNYTVSEKSVVVKLLLYVVLTTFGLSIYWSELSHELIIIYYTLLSIFRAIGSWYMISSNDYTCNITKNHLILGILLNIVIILPGLFYLF